MYIQYKIENQTRLLSKSKHSFLGNEAHADKAVQQEMSQFLLVFCCPRF